MAITILPKRETIGEKFGTGLGTGIGSVLSNLAESKLKSIQTRNFAQTLEQAGIPGQVAQLIASSPPELQKSLLDRLEGLKLGGTQGEPGQPGTVTIGAPSQERRHRETLAQQKELAEKKLIAADQREINKQARDHIKELSADKKNAEPLLSSAKKALDILEKNPEKFSNVILRNLPVKLRQDPDVRRVSQLYNDIVINRLAGIKRPSQYVAQLIERAKASLDKPIETQKAILKDVLREFSKPAKKLELAKDIKKENQNKWPEDLSLAVDERHEKLQQNMVNEAQDSISRDVEAQKLPDGSVVENEDGFTFEKKEGQWVFVG